MHSPHIDKSSISQLKIIELWSICQHLFTKSIEFLSIVFSDVCMNGYDFWNRVDRKKKCSSKELADKVGMNYSSMLTMRSRCNLPNIEMIIKFSKELDTSIDWLLTGYTSNVSEEAKYVEENPDAKLLVRAIMQNPHLLSVISTLLRTDIDKGKDSAM